MLVIYVFQIVLMNTVLILLINLIIIYHYKVEHIFYNQCLNVYFVGEQFPILLQYV